MRTTVLFIAAAAAVLACAEEPHAKGHYTMTFTKSDPVGDFTVMRRRLSSSFSSSSNAKNDYGYDVSARTYEVDVPDSYDAAKPAPLFVWISATDGGGMQRQLRDSLAKRGFIYVGANGTGNEVKVPIRFRAAIDAVFNLKQLYNIDPKQIYIAGNSGGGRCASELAIGYADVFTGGGFYVIGCNFWDNLPSEKGGIYPGFMKKRDGKIFSLAKGHYFVFLTGSKDFNRDGTSKAYAGYKKAGFANCFYNETNGLGHETPPAEDMEKAFAFLDHSLHADAYAALALAEKSAKGRRYADAAKKIAPFRGTCTAVDDMWSGFVAQAEDETEKVLSNASLNPASRKMKLRDIVSRFGPDIAAKAKSELDASNAK